MKRIFLSIFFILFLFLNWSCEEVIQIDLNAANPKLIVEATISNRPGPYYVKLSKSESYFESNNNFPKVTRAVVTIADNTGVSETLVETSPGIYKTSTLQSVCGRTYSLKIVAEGKTYLSSSYLPYIVDLQDAIALKSTSSGPMHGGSNKYYVKAIFNDPNTTADFYRIEPISSKPDSLAGFYQIYNDEVSNGQRIEFALQQLTFSLGDTVSVSLMHINTDAYDYYKTANNILRSKRGPVSSAPQANPLSNISGGALGYFGTFTISEKTIIIK